MPAPTRPGPFTTEPNALNVPKGVVGVYTDVETDGELAALRTWVTEQVTNAVTGGTVDLSDYATTLSLTEAVQDLTSQITNRYTKDEVDALLTGDVVGHDGDPPMPGGMTPQDFVDAYSVLPNGAHYYRGQQALVLVRTADVGADAKQVDVHRIDPVRVTIVRASTYVPLPGTAVWTPSSIVTQDGASFMRLEASLPTDTFTPVAQVDVFSPPAVDVLEAIKNRPIEPKLVAMPENGSVKFGDKLTVYPDLTVRGEYRLNIVDETTGTRRTVVCASQEDVAREIATATDNAVTAATLNAVTADIVALLGDKADKATTYTKVEIDAKVRELSLDTQAVNDQTAATFQLFSDGLVPTLALKADKADTYTKGEVDASLAGAGAAITQIQDNVSNANIKITALEADKADKLTTYTKGEVDALVAGAGSGGAVDLSTYATNDALSAAVATLTAEDARLDALAQAAGAISLNNVATLKDNVYTKAESDGKFVPLSGFTSETIVAAIEGQSVRVQDLHVEGSAITLGDGSAIASGNGRLMYAPDINDPNALRQLAFSSEVPGAPDLSPYAKLNDTAQAVVARTVTAEAVVAPNLFFDVARGFTVRDTGEGYGERLYYAKGLELDGVVLKSDLEPIFESLDLAPYAKSADVAATYATKKEVVDGWQAIALANTVFTNGANIPIIRRVLGDSFQIVGEARTMNAIPTDGWFQVGTIPRPWPTRNTPDFTIATTDAAYLPGFALCYVASDGKVWIKPSLVGVRQLAWNNVVTHYPDRPLRNGEQPSGAYVSDRPQAEAT